MAKASNGKSAPVGARNGSTTLPGGVKVTRRKLSDFTLDPRNANKGTTRGAAMLENSVGKFGPARSGLADRDGVIRAGNHTAEQLFAAGIEDVIEVETNGQAWVVVKRTDMDGNVGQEYALYDNRTGQLIEWDAGVLAELKASGVDMAALWSEDEFADVLSKVSGDAGAGSENNYSRKIDIPIYEPSGDKPPASMLTDTGRYQALVEEISRDPSLDDETRAFLLLAATRHIVFNYARIADFYAHSEPSVQRLMENSALVIIDYDRALELGYATLTKRIAELIRSEHDAD